MKRSSTKALLLQLAALAVLAGLLVGCASSAASRTETAAVASAPPTETFTPGATYLRIEGQLVRAVFVPDPLQGALYALTDQRLYQRTSDGWQPTNTVADARRTLVNPQAPLQLLRGGHPPCNIPNASTVLFERSEDGGLSWHSVTDADNVRPDAVDAELPQVVYGSNCRLMISNDSGVTWREVAGAPFRAIVAQLPYNSHLLVLDQGSEHKRQLRTVDLSAIDALEFSDVLLEAPDLSCIAAHGERIVAGGVSGVYVSDDGGASWSYSRVGLESVTEEPGSLAPPSRTDKPDMLGVVTVSLDPNRASWIFAGTAYGLYISQDDGATWSLYDEAPVDVRVLAIQPANDGADLYVTTEQGVVIVPHP